MKWTAYYKTFGNNGVWVSADATDEFDGDTLREVIANIKRESGAEPTDDGKLCRCFRRKTPSGGNQYIIACKKTNVQSHLDWLNLSFDEYCEKYSY